MFEMFKKKEMNTSAAQSFWTWYSANEPTIIKKLTEVSMDLIWMIDKQLAPVFPYVKSLEFELGGYNNGKYEFSFFYCGKKYLKNDAETLKSMMPIELAQHINFIIER